MAQGLKSEPVGAYTSSECVEVYTGSFLESILLGKLIEAVQARRKTQVAVLGAYLPKTS